MGWTKRAASAATTLALLASATGGPVSAQAPLPASGPVATPAGCHWSERGDGSSALWCKDRAGAFHPTGDVQASNLGSGDGCPAGSFYNGLTCVGALNTASPAKIATLKPIEQTEHKRFLKGLAKSLDEVVATDSAAWLANRYDAGSMTNTRTLVHGSDRRSAQVYGEYTFNGGRHGWVKARIAGGRYTCLEYWDGQGCRAIGHPESHAVAAGLMLAMFAGAMSGGGGGSSQSSTHYEIERRDGYAPSPSYASAPMTPIGGDRGLYGADHSCC